MLFHTIDFAIFLPIVFILYWFFAGKRVNLQNSLIVVSSYVFYGLWDWRFLSLIVFSTIVDYSVGYKLKKEKNQIKRKLLLWISILVNLGILGFFKYYNFFLENFISTFLFFGTELKASTLHIVLPVGISFYTFQTLSYTIDVYKRNLEPTKDFIAFSAFVTFFPQLVAGPIERATNLLPQFFDKRTFDYSKAVNGMRQILWGLFKKIVIADNCAEYVNHIFDNSNEYSGVILVLGAIFFTFQIYGDFSGYSDVAIGLSRLFGLNLRRNFAFPYFSRDIAEFWRRWHISLSTWFRDYLYIPLGGSRGGTLMKVRNTFIIFLVSGFWHGSNWTFVVWGALNAIFFVPLLLSNNNRNHIDIVAKGKLFPSLKETGLMLMTFLLTVFAWIFFRAENIGHAFSYINRIFIMSLAKPNNFNGFSLPLTSIILLIGLFVLIEWLGRQQQYAIEKLRFPLIIRWILYLIIGMFIILFGNFKETEFIYFAF